MPYQEIDDFTSGQILSTAVMNTLRENVEENRDRQAGAARSYTTRSSVGTVHGDSYGVSFPSTPIMSVTLEFHGRPVILLFGGVLELQNNAGTIEIGYKIDQGNIVSFYGASTASGQRNFNTLPPLIVTDTSAGQHTIALFFANEAIAGRERGWKNPTMFVWELPFDSFD